MNQVQINNLKEKMEARFDRAVVGKREAKRNMDEKQMKI